MGAVPLAEFLLPFTEDGTYQWAVVTSTAMTTASVAKASIFSRIFMHNQDKNRRL